MTDPVQVVIESTDPDWRHTPEYLHKYLPAAQVKVSSGGTKHRRGSVTDEQQALCNHLVTRYSGHSVSVDRHGEVYVVRPEKPARKGHSATIIVGAEGDALLTVFSDHWPGLAKGNYMLGVDGELHHPSDPLAKFTISASPALPAPAHIGEVRTGFRRYTVAELLGEDRTMQWDVMGMLARSSYGLDGGELKSLKSYFALARAVGLAAGVPVLGQWKVPERKRVLAFVAEGGRLPFRTRLERMCQAHGVDPASLDGWLEVITEVAPLNSRRFRESLAADLADFRPDFVWLDPLYPFQPQDVSSSQLSDVGAMLTGAHLLCAEHGATFWVTAHMNQTGTGFDLKRIAGAGPGEWADSWALLKHRIPADVPAGKFRLRLDLGSRQWGGSSWDLDLNIGRFIPDMGLHDGPITWHVQPASTVQTAAVDPLIDVKVDVLAAGRHARKPLTRQAWLARVNRRLEQKRAAFDELVADGVIAPVGGSQRSPTFQIPGVP